MQYFKNVILSVETNLIIDIFFTNIFFNSFPIFIQYYNRAEYLKYLVP